MSAMMITQEERLRRRALWVDAYDCPPEQPGCYAVLQCWDAEEGWFPQAARWDGERWSERAVAMRSPQTFASEAEARNWAAEHDPEM